VCVGARSDIPKHLFLKLLANASERVRATLEAERPYAKREIGEVIHEVAGRIRDEALGEAPSDVPVSSAKFDDNKIRALALAGRIDETTAGMAAMCGLPASFVRRALAEERSETLLVLARAIGLSWPTVKAILVLPARKRPILAGELAQCLGNFERLSRATSKEIVGFYQARERAGTLQS
jgi:hypothetical protein